MMILAVINGTVRDFVYKPYVGELPAHQISTVTLIILFALYFWLLAKKWKTDSDRQAWIIGIIWLVMTVGVEFGLGLRRGLSWDVMLQAYNIFDGRVWVFIPLFVLVGPYLFRRFVK